MESKNVFSWLTYGNYDAITVPTRSLVKHSGFLRTAEPRIESSLYIRIHASWVAYLSNVVEMEITMMWSSLLIVSRLFIHLSRYFVQFID